MIEYQRVVTDSLIGAEAEDGAGPAKRRKVATDPPPRSSVAAITTLKQIGDILRTMYADLSFGASGTLSMDLGGAPNPAGQAAEWNGVGRLAADRPGDYGGGTA